LQLFAGHFDTEVGPKVESDSYMNIVKKLDCRSEDIVFLTDLPRGKILKYSSCQMTCLSISELCLSFLYSTYSVVTLNGIQYSSLYICETVQHIIHKGFQNENLVRLRYNRDFIIVTEMIGTVRFVACMENLCRRRGLS
jgi:hypothetical protein